VTYPLELQAYFRAHDRMITLERWAANDAFAGSVKFEEMWAEAWGRYKVARYNDVKAGYLPETPEFG